MARPAYPHMLEIECDIWSRFLISFGDRWERYDYDVHVGSAAKVPAGAGEEMERFVKAVTRKRIDAVGWSEAIPTIFEVKPYAGMSALGQLEAYQLLYHSEFPTVPEPGLAVVTDRLPLDMEGIFHLKGIQVYEV